MNLEFIHNSDPIIAAVFLALIAMSLISWMIGFSKISQWLLDQWRISRFMKTHDDRLFHAAITELGIHSGQLGFLLQTLQAVQSVAQNSEPNQLEATLQLGIQQTLEKLQTRMEAGLTVLASVGSAAPFIGLFGTVWGIYLALRDISLEQTASISVVAGPMGEALLATAIGLFAAIPAVLAYNTFLRLNTKQSQQLRHIAERLQFPLYQAIRSQQVG